MNFGILNGQSTATAFTMVEVLVVLFIIAILVSLTVGIGSQVYENAWKSQTRKHQAILMAAVDAFHRAGGAYPAEGSIDSYVDRSNRLHDQLLAAEASRAMVAELPPEAIGLAANSANTQVKVFLDGRGRCMDYRENKGLAGGPVIISGGADDTIGSPPDDAAHQDGRFTMDNIRSDQL